MLVAATIMPVASVVICLVEVASLMAVSAVLLMAAVPTAGVPKSSVDNGAERR